TRSDELGARMLQIGGQLLEIRREPHRVYCHPDLGGQLAQEALVSRGQGFARLAGGEHQFSHGFGLIDQGDMRLWFLLVDHSLTCPRVWLSATLAWSPGNRHRRKFERLGDSFDDSWKHGVRGQGRLQTLTQAGEDTSWFVTIPIEQVVDTLLQAQAQWLK